MNPKNIAKELYIFHQDLDTDNPFSVNWYVRSIGGGAGAVYGFLAYQDSLIDYELHHVGAHMSYIPMDGKWRSTELYYEAIAKIGKYTQVGQWDCPWFILRGDAFCFLDYYDDEGNPK